jgi:mannitol/fructose-specific phosphotransferase system IIA component (Ntr-type)
MSYYYEYTIVIICIIYRYDDLWGFLPNRFLRVFYLDKNRNYSYTNGMDLRTVLTTDTVDLHLKGTTKEEIIDEMLDILVKAGKVTDKAAARECVLDRERKMSTGMKHGIAIPHGKTDTVSDLVACIGISDNPVDFDSLDQEPCRIFIMTLSPVNKTGPHLQFLAEVSLLFKSPEKRQLILNTQDKAEVIKILTE